MRTVVAAFDADAEAARILRLSRAWSVISAPVDPGAARAHLLNMVREEDRLRDAGSWTSGPTSLLDVLGLVHDEVRNCRVVRWLLDPLAPHGLALGILERLVRDLESRAAPAPLAFEAHPRTQVHVEVTRDKTRADIVLENPTGTLVIEAKIGAGEQDRQGERLSTLWPGATYVYLTRSGRAMTTARDDVPWMPLRWRDLHRQVDSALRSAPPASTRAAASARATVQNYLDAMRRL